MWNALPITGDLYGFQLEHSYAKPWTATVAVRQSEDDLELSADVFLFDLKDKEPYEELIEAIRRFSMKLKRDTGKHTCRLTVRCKGLADESGDLPLLVSSSPDGSLLIDVEFSEAL
ncbi:hypothetical protein ACFFNY_10995 [Paenibacillus hodogayensis]|uniref:Uncharacterized protein n=1 Tax=Paenibacillus hodogayensis TaxID=279208 RepID=A0ABV5VUW2_9BACL